LSILADYSGHSFAIIKKQFLYSSGIRDA